MGLWHSPPSAKRENNLLLVQLGAILRNFRKLKVFHTPGLFSLLPLLTSFVSQDPFSHFTPFFQNGAQGEKTGPWLLPCFLSGAGTAWDSSLRLWFSLYQQRTSGLHFFNYRRGRMIKYLSDWLMGQTKTWSEIVGVKALCEVNWWINIWCVEWVHLLSAYHCLIV